MSHIPKVNIDLTDGTGQPFGRLGSTNRQEVGVVSRGAQLNDQGILVSAHVLDDFRKAVVDVASEDRALGQPRQTSRPAQRLDVAATPERRPGPGLATTSASPSRTSLLDAWTGAFAIFNLTWQRTF